MRSQCALRFICSHRDCQWPSLGNRSDLPNLRQNVSFHIFELLLRDLATRVPFLQNVQRGVLSAHPPLIHQPLGQQDQSSNEQHPKQHHGHESEPHHRHPGGVRESPHFKLPPPPPWSTVRCTA